MGCTHSQSTTPAEAKKDPQGGEVVEVELKKHKPECTGLYWRQDPTPGATKLQSNDNWPRDNAKLRGRVVEIKGKKWLACTHVKQKGSLRWIAAPKGAGMPFEYQDHYYLE